MIPHYHSGFIVSLTPMPPGKTGIELVAGDRMYNVLGGITARPTILENSPTQFRWRGPWPYTHLNLLCGWHTFKFIPSTTTPGHTLFIHEETFTGPLAWVMGLENPKRRTMAKFYKFNTDFRTWLEEGLKDGGEGIMEISGENEVSLGKEKIIPMVKVRSVNN
jgi:hypothetical protein